MTSPSAVFVRLANSVRLLFVTWAGMLLVAAGFYWWFEKAVTFRDSLYWATVTATTLGYGDLSPHSGAGKLLTGVLISISVFFLVPTITANLASKLIVNRDAFTHEEQEEMKGELRALVEALHAQSLVRAESGEGV